MISLRKQLKYTRRAQRSIRSLTATPRLHRAPHRCFIGIVLFILVGVVAVIPASPSRGQTNPSVQDKAEELFFVAQKAFDDGFYDVAARYLEDFLHLYPDHPRWIQAKLLLAQCHFFQNRYLKAYEILDSIKDQTAFRDAILYWLGETHFKGADFQKARSYYDQVIQLYPDSEYRPQAIYSWAWAHFMEGHLQKALDGFNRLLGEYPDHTLAEDALFKKGEVLHAMGEYEAAANVFETYYQRYRSNPRAAEAAFKAGEAFYYGQNYLAAIPWYARCADQTNDPRLKFAALIGQGWAYLKLKKFDLAGSSFNKARATASEQGLSAMDADLGLAALFTEQKQYSEALSAYERIVQAARMPQNEETLLHALLGMANCHYTLQQYDKAQATYQRLIRILEEKMPVKDPLSATRGDVWEKAHYGLAWTYLKKGEPDQAIQVFEQIAAHTQSDAVKISALMQIGDAYLQTNQPQKALAVWERLLNEFPNNPHLDYVQLRHAVSLLKLGRPDAALMSLNGLRHHFPKSPYAADALYYMALAYHQKGDDAKVEGLVKAYLDAAVFPKWLNDEALFLAGQSLMNIKQYDKALEYFRRLAAETEKESLRAQARLYTAECLYLLGRKAEALVLFRELTQEYPLEAGVQEAWLWLGDHFFQEENFDQARLYYAQYIERFPDGPYRDRVLFQLGQIHEANKEFEQALETYRRITPKKDSLLYAKARLKIADILSKGRSLQEAGDFYRQIAEALPEFKRDALARLAQLYLNSSDQKDQAVVYWRRALEADQGRSELTDAELRFHLADTLEQLQKKEQALAEYLKIPYLYPDDTYWVVKAYLRAGRLYEETEQWPQALTVYKKLETLPSPEAQYAKERREWITSRGLASENDGSR